MRALKSAGLLMLVLSITVVGLAVPTINVSVEEIGEGSQRLVSPVLDGSIWFNLGLSGGELVFPRDLPSGTRIYVSLEDSNNNTVAYNYSITLSSDLPAGSVLGYSLENPSNAARTDVVRAVVTIVTPNYQTTLTSGTITVNVREIGVGIANTTKFCTPITIAERSGNDLYNYSVLIALDDSGNTDSELWKVDWNVINASNLYFTDENGSPLYFWVQYLDANARIAYLWVKLPKLPADSKEVVCLNYGVWPNPYAGYHDLYKTFLFVDDFYAFNASTWESNSPITVNGGVLQLSAGQWLWTRRSFGQHYAVHIAAYMGSDDGRRFDNAPNNGNIVYYSLGPFLMGYIAPDNTAYADGAGGAYIFGSLRLDAKGSLRFVIPADPDSSGYWSASVASNSYQLQAGSYISMTLYNGRLSFYQKTSGLDWGNISTYTQISTYTVNVDGDGRIGFGQWSGGPSYYGWVVVRNYADPEPSVSVGYWYYKLVFYPQPPAAAATDFSTASRALPLRSSNALQEDGMGLLAVPLSGTPRAVLHESTPQTENGERRGK
ncbi:hypothetical protein A3L09_06945 [Thermococcus profundus]|uniref:DUF2341 domain-containing protein n=1 Tax=Thermococcus profundus TaxID=49899 RepID=A0A2Z2M929_THEPR|nr:DUF2341 domain-containing protein [Thermococcus profundus]ASJ03010.1 hypothetical protein A3L09_06945 [Thermococcus profundus]